jgi:hypothetical protein
MKIKARTIGYGKMEVPVLERAWTTTAKRVPYRKTYVLKPGQHWKDAPVTPDQWEYYVLLEDAEVSLRGERCAPVIVYPQDRQFRLDCVPAGAAIARELKIEAATSVVWTELWAGRRVLMGPDLICVDEEGPIRELLKQLRIATGRRLLGGLPDVVACFPDGRIAMREAKHVATKYKDRLGPKQHELATVAQRLFGSRLDLAVVEWGLQSDSEDT